MKLGFIDLYRQGANPHKDPIATPRELQACGHVLQLISCDRTVTDRFETAGLPVLPVAAMADGGWRRAGFDAVVALSRFAPALTPMLREIKAAGIPLIVKGDTDGTLGYPLRPNYLRMVPPLAKPGNILRHLKWRLPVRHWVGQKLAHVALADRVVVESPGAAANLVQVLRHWGLETDAAKVRFIPNQVSHHVIDRPVSVAKPRRILAVGRWDDALCKGADLLAATITGLLALRGDYNVTVVGSGLQEVRSRLSDRVAEAIELIDEIDFDALQEIVASTRILLVPSRVESFSFVSAEALCAGASLAATPIESLTYLTGGGAWGTVARDFSAPAITAALLSEIRRWEDERHDPQQTAAHWRSRLSPAVVAELWTRLLEDVSARSESGELW